VVPATGGRRDRHDAEERLQFEIEAPGQPPDHPLFVERDVNEPHLLEIIGQSTGERTDGVVAPVLVELDRPDADLEHLPGFRTAHRHRPGEDVRAAKLRLHLLMNCRELRQHCQTAPRFRQMAERARHGRDRNGVAGIDGYERLQRGVEVAPVHGLGRSVQSVRGHWRLLNPSS
jgi:hypothetical protein